VNIDPRFKDPSWRLENLYFIVDKSGNKSKFKPNYIQRLLNKETAKRKLILKARQVGITTNELLKMSDYVFFGKNKTAMVLAHEQDALEKLFRIPKRAYDYLHPQLQPELDRGGGSRFAMYFPKNNSRIYCDLENRGSTVNWLHISEMAFVKERSRVLATLESVPIDGIITIESTPNGLNEFYEAYMDQDSNYKKIFYPWYFQEEYAISNHEIKQSDLTEDEVRLQKYGLSKYGVHISMDQIAFRRFKQRELKGMFHQEYSENDATCFLTSGQNPFRLEIIKPMYDNAPKPIKLINGIRIYEEWKKDELYVIGSDPAEGVEGDHSAAHVFKVSTREQVASFNANNLKPSEFADVLIEMANLYSRAYPPLLLGVERNNHGHAVLLKLDEVHNYANLYRTRKENKKTELEEMKLGWTTDRVTRPLMIDVFIEGVENGTIILNDRQTLGECLTLTNNEGKIEAEETKHDDLFISACIALQMCIEEGVLDVYSDIRGKIKS